MVERDALPSRLPDVSALPLSTLRSLRTPEIVEALRRICEQALREGDDRVQEQR
ncbi:hypothetical protein LV78_002639 [Actinosynnema pretiosum]|nr:hypothetical protein [Actinosynnema pretiosum]